MAAPGYGFCGCGCGERTRIAGTSDRANGRVKGQALRYVHGHNAARAEYTEQDCGHSTPCWLWSGKRSKRGYGRVIRGGRTMPAHVFMWEREHGPVPDGLELDHLCHNPPCCNPAHMEPVTHAENTRRSVRCVLNEEKVREIRRLSEAGLFQREIATRIGVSRSTVGNVLTGVNWTDVGLA